MWCQVAGETCVNLQSGYDLAMGYSTGAVGKFFDVSRETIRQWAIEYGDYLSPGANPAKGAYRQFTEDDMTVFAYIVQAKSGGLSPDDIAINLKNGERAEPTADMGSLKPSAERPSQIAAYQKELERVNAKVAELETQQQRDSAKIELLHAELQKARERIDQLNREIGRLEAGRHDTT